MYKNKFISQSSLALNYHNPMNRYIIYYYTLFLSFPIQILIIIVRTTNIICIGQFLHLMIQHIILININYNNLVHLRNFGTYVVLGNNTYIACIYRLPRMIKWYYNIMSINCFISKWRATHGSRISGVLWDKNIIFQRLFFVRI